MLFPFTTLCLVGLIVIARSADNRRSPLVLALSVWLASAVVGPVLFRYTVSYSLLADAFAAACLCATTVAYLLTRRKGDTPPRNYEGKDVDVRLAQIIALLGILGCLLLLGDATRSGTPLSLSHLLANLGRIRDSRFDALANSAAQSPIAVVGSYLASCSYLTVLAAGRLGRAGRLHILAAVNFALVSAVSLLVYAGRATLFYVGLLLLTGLYVGRRRVRAPNARSIVVGLLVATAVWYFSVPWLTNRERQHNSNPIAILAYTQRSKVRTPMEPAVQRNRAIGMALVSVGYFTSPLPTLSFYIQQEPLPGPLWGRYSYPLPTRTLAKITGAYVPTMWLDSRRQAFLPFEKAGYFPNVWTTWLRDILVDFGYVGAVLFCGAFGAFMALARNAYERTGQLCYHYLEAVSCFTLTFGAFTGVLNNTLVSNAFFIALAIMIFTRMGAFALLAPGAAHDASRTDVLPHASVR